jgi:hypothetical protein
MSIPPDHPEELEQNDCYYKLSKFGKFLTPQFKSYPDLPEFGIDSSGCICKKGNTPMELHNWQKIREFHPIVFKMKQFWFGNLSAMVTMKDE